MDVLTCHFLKDFWMTEQDDRDDRDHVTLFRGAADNPYFELYFNAPPTPAGEKVEMQSLDVDLRPHREMTLHVEVFNPSGSIPLIVTPGGMGECDGFRGFARNVAGGAPDLNVIIWDRRNMGRSEVSFGTEPLAIEEAEDLQQRDIGSAEEALRSTCAL